MNVKTALMAGALGVATALSGLVPALAAGGPRLLGGGWVGNPNDKVHVAVNLPCSSQGGVDPSDPSKLQLRGRSSSFSLDRIVSALCQNNLHEGSGMGTCNGVGGFIINWRLTDGGLGGPDTREDRIEVEVRGPSGTCSLSVAGPLVGGNIKIQASGRG